MCLKLVHVILSLVTVSAFAQTTELPEEGKRPLYGTDSGGGGGECKREFADTFRELMDDMQTYNQYLRSELFHASDNSYRIFFDKNFLPEGTEPNHISSDPALDFFREFFGYQTYQQERFGLRYDFKKLRDIFFGEDAASLVTVKDIQSCPDSEVGTFCAVPAENNLYIDCEGENSWLANKDDVDKRKDALHEVLWWFGRADKNQIVSGAIVDQLENLKRPLPKKGARVFSRAETMYFRSANNCDFHTYMNGEEVQRPRIFVGAGAKLRVLEKPVLAEGIPVVHVEVLENSPSAMTWQPALWAPPGCEGELPLYFLDIKKAGRK